LTTNLALDDNLVDQAMKIGHLRSKQEAVTVALKEFIQRHQQKRILDLAGKITFREDWDYKKDRVDRECDR
jgi:Arc/MetJ family transcription regulator